MQLAVDRCIQVRFLARGYYQDIGKIQCGVSSVRFRAISRDEITKSNLKEKIQEKYNSTISQYQKNLNNFVVDKYLNHQRNIYK